MTGRKAGFLAVSFLAIFCTFAQNKGPVTTTKTKEAKEAVDRLKKNPRANKKEKVLVYNEDFEKGEELFKLNKPEEALPYFEKSLDSENVNPNVYVYLGVCYYQIEKYDKSLDICVKGLAKEGTDKKVLAYNAGNSCYAMGNYMRADSCYSLALREDENYSPAMLNRANARLKLDHLEDSKNDYIAYLEMDKESPQKERIEKIIALLSQEIERRANEKPELINPDSFVANEKMEVPPIVEKVNESLPVEEKVLEIAKENVGSDAVAPEIPREQLALSSPGKAIARDDYIAPALPVEIMERTTGEKINERAPQNTDTVAENPDPLPSEKVSNPEISQPFSEIKSSPEKPSGEKVANPDLTLPSGQSPSYSKINGEKVANLEDLAFFEQEAKRLAEENKRLREETEILRAREAEKARLQEENKIKIEAEKARLEAESKLKAEIERMRLEEENRRAMEAERAKIEEERRKMEEERQKMLEESRQRQFEEEKRLLLEAQKAQFEAQQKAMEAEQARITEERRKADQARAIEDAKRAAVEEAKRQAEEERKAQEEARRQEEEAKRQEEAKKAAEAKAQEKAKKQAEIAKWPSPRAELAIDKPYNFTPDGDGYNDTIILSPSVEYLEDEVESWTLTINDPKGHVFYTKSGQGSFPSQIEWDGKGDNGEVVLSKNTYTANFSVKPSGKDIARTKKSQIESSKNINTGLLLEVIVPGHEWKMVVNSINFVPNGALDERKLTSEQMAANEETIEDIVKQIKEHPGAKVVIVEGYANNISGTEKENREELMPLSQLRADAIVKELVKRGVDPKLLSSEGKGGANPMASRQDHDNWWKNRRVEFRIKQ